MSIPETLRKYFSQHSRVFKRRTSLLLACSGGPDSVALVYGLKEIEPTLTFRIHLGHVNHGLRKKESEKDAKFVRSLAKKMDWPVHLEKIKIRTKDAGNLEEKARLKRYEILTQMAKKHKCGAILTGHNRDDQVETILMNLSRGSGGQGLRGMLPLREMAHRLFLARPLLNISKKEIARYLGEKRASYRVDKTNDNQHFLRNWFRRTLIPLWESRCFHLVDGIMDVGQILQEEEKVWNQLTKSFVKKVSTPYRTGHVLDSQKMLRYPLAIQRRVLREMAGSDLLTFKTIERLRGWMISPPANGRIFQLRRGWIVERLSKSKGAPSSHHYWFYRKDSKRTEKENTR
ncbi:tRNA lysidine(34) synthetase TilS [bacterium F11]|nr:tRNA lysidine(34) synthetase TilS [bacterium F11]